MKWNELKRELEDSLSRNLTVLRQEEGTFTEERLKQMFRAVLNNVECAMKLDADVAVLEMEEPRLGPKLKVEDHRMECCGCCKVMPMTELSLIHPRRKDSLEGKHDAWTEEPDFFCQPCREVLRLNDLPELDKDKWLNKETF